MRSTFAVIVGAVVASMLLSASASGASFEVLGRANGPAKGSGNSAFLPKREGAAQLVDLATRRREDIRLGDACSAADYSYGRVLMSCAPDRQARYNSVLRVETGKSRVLPRREGFVAPELTDLGRYWATGTACEPRCSAIAQNLRSGAVRGTYSGTARPADPDTRALRRRRTCVAVDSVEQIDGHFVTFSAGGSVFVRDCPGKSRRLGRYRGSLPPIARDGRFAFAQGRRVHLYDRILRRAWSWRLPDLPTGSVQGVVRVDFARSGLVVSDPRGDGSGRKTRVYFRRFPPRR